MKKTLYQPVLKNNDGRCYTVNGAINQDYEVAKRLANLHSSVQSGEATIVRVDKIEVDDNGPYSNY